MEKIYLPRIGRPTPTVDTNIVVNLQISFDAFTLAKTAFVGSAMAVMATCMLCVRVLWILLTHPTYIMWGFSIIMGWNVLEKIIV